MNIHSTQSFISTQAIRHWWFVWLFTVGIAVLLLQQYTHAAGASRSSQIEKMEIVEITLKDFVTKKPLPNIRLTAREHVPHNCGCTGSQKCLCAESPKLSAVTDKQGKAIFTAKTVEFLPFDAMGYGERIHALHVMNFDRKTKDTYDLFRENRTDKQRKIELRLPPLSRVKVRSEEQARKMFLAETSIKNCMQKHPDASLSMYPKDGPYWWDAVMTHERSGARIFVSINALEGKIIVRKRENAACAGLGKDATDYCSTLAVQLDTMRNDNNYCNADADCRVTRDDLQCNVFYNKKAPIESYLQEADHFASLCYEFAGGVPKCGSPPEKIVCREHRCVDPRWK